jgi:serine/threonine protein kinase
MGAVYKARHRLMDRFVALKVIRKRFLRSTSAVERFSREVRAAASLSHPNIAAAYDAERAGETHFLVMELVEGGNLAEVVAEKGQLPVPIACDYIRQAALGLQHAWERGTVHRDIKPRNLMLTPEGQIKILDFGLARFLREASAQGETSQEHNATFTESPAFRCLSSEAMTQHGTFMGTADFIAPEQASDARTADIRADIYSLGCTLYYLLTGKAPFHAHSPTHKIAAHRDCFPEPAASLRNDVPSELARVLDRMMAKRPEDRFQTPGKVADALVPFASPVQFCSLIQQVQNAVQDARLNDVDSLFMSMCGIAMNYAMNSTDPNLLLSIEASHCALAGDWKGAKAAHRQVLENALEPQNCGERFQAHYELSGLHNHLKEHEIALDHARKATVAARETGVSILIGMALERVADCAFQLNKTVEALEALDEAIEKVLTGSMDGLLRAVCLTWRAKYRALNNDIPTARRDLEEAWELLEREPASTMAAGVHAGLAFWWSITAELRTKQGDNPGAEQACAEAVLRRRHIVSCPQARTPVTATSLATALRSYSDVLSNNGKQGQAEEALAESSRILHAIGLSSRDE